MSPIELTDVSAGYGRDLVIRDTTIKVDQGITLLAAPNGSGKTTFLRLCAGILQPASGAVTVFGGDPYADPGIRAMIGYLSHQVGLEPRLTVVENLEFWARMRGVGPRQRRIAVSGVIADLGLGEIAASRAGMLSRGQRQRVTFARVLLGRPNLLLLDEPATGLDPGWYEQITQILESQVRDDGGCVLLASHDPRDHAAGWQVLEIAEGVIRSRSRNDGSRAACYRVQVASPVRIVHDGPWRIDYQGDDPAVMLVTVAGSGALAGFVTALEKVSAIVVSISLLSRVPGHPAECADGDQALSGPEKRS